MPVCLLVPSLRWHRVAYSVRDKSVTLFLDCELVGTVELLRSDSPVVGTDGVSALGTPPTDGAAFEVGVLSLTDRSIDCTF